MKLNSAELIARISHALAPDFTVMPLHAPDAPIFLAVALPSEEGTTGLKPRLPAGRGMTTGQAMIAAGAEALELRASLAQHHLAEVQGLPRLGGLAMATATDLLSHMPVAVPAQQVYLDCAAVLSEPLQVDANSTGCAAGRDLDSARTTALWECIERDAVALWWHGNRPALALPLELIDAHQPRLYWWLHQRSRQTRLLDLTTDIGLPVVAAVSADADGRVVATGTAARPLLADAALAAVTEMVQTEVSIDLAREAGDPEVLAWIERASMTEQPQFQTGTPSGDSVPLAQGTLLDRLAALGHRVLGIDLSLPDDPLPSARVMVPGLCAMRGGTDTPRFARLCPDAPGLTLPEPY